LGEVAATVAGFSGIVAVLGVRSVDSLAAVARFRLVNLLVISLSAVFFSFLPVVLDQFTLAPAALWCVSSASLAVVWVTLFLILGRQVRRLSFGGPRAPRRWMASVFFVVAVLAFGSQAANLVGLRGSPSGALYCVGVLALLVVAGLQFILLVLETQDRPSPPPAV
jgi:hypothetical protein